MRPELEKRQEKHGKQYEKEHFLEEVYRESLQIVPKKILLKVSCI